LSEAECNVARRRSVWIALADGLIAGAAVAIIYFI
jgi:hypothetical protein